MDSSVADDSSERASSSGHAENGVESEGQKPVVNGHTKSHSRQNSTSCTNGDFDMPPDTDKPVPEKTHTGAYEKLKGIFRSKSSAGSKSKSTPQIKVSMHPEGQEDKKMSQKGSRSTKLTLDSHEADGESDTDFEIPNDGNLYAYSVDNMMQFFKYLNFDDKIIKSLQRRKVDGRRFSKLTDDDLKKYGINNPVVVYFRGKSEKKRDSAKMFML